MPACLDEVAENGLLAQLLAGFQSMQAFHQHQAGAVLPHQNRGLLTDLQHALGDLMRLLGVERRPPFRRHIDVCDREALALHHGDDNTTATPVAKWRYFGALGKYRRSGGGWSLRTGIR